MTTNPLYDSVIEMVELTNRSIFITGKAGTGKTTMLRKIVSRNFKRAVVVAPTGVAAVNAEGMTIHSFFQIPFGPQPPTSQSRHSLIAQQKIRKERLAIFRELELLIIDEISMVRADLLDAIDTVLRFYRHRADLPFGGVQVVFFGDLYQLAPVVTEDERQYIETYYTSPYFFNSKVMAELKPVVVELDTIFRQTNSEFITLLNELRNNCVSQQSLQMLASRFDSSYQLKENDHSILLTTHNLKADTVNTQQMMALNTRSTKFHAIVKDDFPEKSYPADNELELKVGARVMFIANDHQTPRRYFNGMIGEVKGFTQDSVTVFCEDSGKTIEVHPEEWANRSYHVDSKTNEIHEKVLGTFSQIPLRLAWAITIHKSQGLTFDKVVIDSSAAFASGQVYVAFSRCRTLEGITLTSMVNQFSLRVDPNVAAYCQTAMTTEAFMRQLEADRQLYSRQLMLDLFDLRPLYAIAIDLRGVATAHAKSFSNGIVDFVGELCTSTSDLSTVASRFMSQLRALPQNELQERIRAAVGYFTPLLDALYKKIDTSRFTTDSRDNADNYLNKLKELYTLVARKRFLMLRLANDFSVKAYFDARQSFTNPPFRVRAYAVESQFDDGDLLNAPLFYALCRWRTAYCDEHDIPKFVMFSTQTLKDVAALLPSNEKQLLRINGFGKVKVARFGEHCLELVRQYCQANNIPFDRQIDFSSNKPQPHVETEHAPSLPTSLSTTLPTSLPTSLPNMKTDPSPSSNKRKNTTTPKPPKLPTTEITFQLLQDGKSIDEIAKERGFRPETIANHICQLIADHRVDGSKYVDADVIQFVASQQAANPDIRLSDIYEKLNSTVPYDILRIAKACVENR